MTDTPADNSVILLQGNYQGKNLYVQNPFDATGTGFCVYDVYVNEKRMEPDELLTSAFEIPLSEFRPKTGDKVTVQIFHRNGCTPKVLNPEALSPRAVSVVSDIRVDTSGETLHWQTTGESGVLPYVVELFRWNKWNPVGQVPGIGSPELHAYSFRMLPFWVSGENKVRVKQTDGTGMPKTSPVAVYTSAKAPVSFRYDNAEKWIRFSAETDWEVYSMYGQVLKKGRGTGFSVSDMAKGAYLLNYDNTSDPFAVK